MKHSRRPRDSNQPYGYGRMETLGENLFDLPALAWISFSTATVQIHDAMFVSVLD